jgi:hypothetical protein
MIHDGEEESGRSDAREEWIESMHRTAPGTDWRRIEYQNRMKRHRERTNSLQRRSDCGLQAFAEGFVRGRWHERGSVNQAGSVFDTEYDPSTNDIWLISAGGTLWKGHLENQQWEVINQDLRFTPGLLAFTPTNNGRRMIAFTGRLPHYSDDDGYTWQAADGIAHNDRWGNIHSPVMVDDSLSTVYVLSKPSYWSDIRLFRSVDQGENYTSVSSFNTHEFNKLTLVKPHGYPKMLLVEKSNDNKAKLYRTHPNTGQLELIHNNSTLNFGNARANMAACVHGDSLMMYAYVSPEEGVWKVMRSTNSGLSWEERGTLPARPWGVGIYVSPSDPNHLVMGEVDCFNSLDGGLTWERVNHWYEYYDDVEGSLHADMMHFSEFETASGQPFMLISNHGGLSVSYDQLESTQNIGLTGLNVSQYYSVRTDPLHPDVVYAGSQDQGFQRATGFDEEGIQAFEQVISGDYGHIAFSNNGQHLWTVYPGGWVTLYTNPTQEYLTASFDLESEDESVWLPPLVNAPTTDDNGIYMAGGNINGGAGSHLIRLEWLNNQITATQGDFDFADASGGGALSTIAASSADTRYWYAATTNGRFFYSRDSMQSWEQSINFIPEGHYLYGQAILASSINPQRVILAGSGYSNPPVYLSTDGGEQFTEMSEGLPNTLVYDMAMNADESQIYAATEAGPFVFVVEKGRWYDIAGGCAPVQTYWSVEYLEDQQLARFGTYGRGIWDFQLDINVNTEQWSQSTTPPRLWPNPALDRVWVGLPEGKAEWDLRLYGSDGRFIQQWLQQSGQTQLPVADLPKGVYFLQIANEKEGLTHLQQLMKM